MLQMGRHYPQLQRFPRIRSFVYTGKHDPRCSCPWFNPDDFLHDLDCLWDVVVDERLITFAEHGFDLRRECWASARATLAMHTSTMGAAWVGDPRKGDNNALAHLSTSLSDAGSSSKVVTEDSVLLFCVEVPFAAQHPCVRGYVCGPYVLNQAAGDRRVWISQRVRTAFTARTEMNRRGLDVLEVTLNLCLCCLFRRSIANFIVFRVCFLFVLFLAPSFNTGVFILAKCQYLTRLEAYQDPSLTAIHPQSYILAPSHHPRILHATRLTVTLRRDSVRGCSSWVASCVVGDTTKMEAQSVLEEEN